MLAASPRKQRKPLFGSPRPRIAPPVPARHGLTDFEAVATKLGIGLWPWQKTAAKYLTAKATGDSPLYREVAIIVARQNGKTELLVPLIVGRLLKGARIMHTAQNRELPRLVHRRLSHILQKHYAGDIEAIRRGAGQEEIWLKSGGHYRIVAPNDDGARGSTNDLVIVDELRQMENHDFIAAAKPTLAGDAQIVYLSNAGTSHSEVLNALKARGGSDPRLAYLEWSADPDLADDDVAGWLQANPAIGHKAGHLEGLSDDYRAHMLAGTLAVFETEQLCRWVLAMEQRLVTDDAYAAQAFVDDPGLPSRAFMAIKMDIAGERVSAVVSWKDAQDVVTLDIHDSRHAPDTERAAIGRDLKEIARIGRAWSVAYDPYTDADLARYIPKSRAMPTREYAAATEKFVNLVNERKLRIHDPAGVLGPDLARTGRKRLQSGAFIGARSGDEPNTAAEAAIRAAWLASEPIPVERARVY